MLNVKTLTDTMSRMQLPDLQKYAALHKNDPYIVSLALSIANQKKQMQASQAGQAGMQQQPKVVDQDIAQMLAPPQQQRMPPPQQQQQMLPEDTGIGQLPAQNMQGMAEGGIVAFGPGGSTGEEDIPEWLKAFPPESGVRRTYRAAKQYDKNNPMPLSATDAYLKNVKDNPSNKLPAGTTFTPPGMPAAQTGAGTLPPGAGSAPPPGAGAVPPPDTGAAPAFKPVGLPALNTKPMTPEQAAAASQKFGDNSAITSGIEALRSDTKAANEDIQKSYEEGRAALPKPGEEAEARLKAREAQDVVGQADAKAMAIFKAGLGMMAGTSQNAFENIGKGAMAGLEDYSASIKEFRKLGIERDKAYADIEAARNAAARDDLKTSTTLKNSAVDRLTRVNEKGIDIAATLFKTDKETAANIWRDGNDQAQANARTQTTEAGATNRALIQANAPTGLERIYRNPELFKRHMESQTAATGMRADAVHRDKWATDPYLQAKYPNIDDYLRIMGVSPTVTAVQAAPNARP